MKKKKKAASNEKTFSEKIANSLEVSKEVILDAPRLIFIGNSELTVENYKSIGEYTEKQIVLETNPNRLFISGEGLEIKSMARELIYITGKIRDVTFKREV